MSDLISLPGKILGGVGSIFSSILGGRQQQEAPAAPAIAAAPPTVAAVEPPPVMPLVDDKAALMQQRKSLASLVKTRGRASTILTADGSLGTPPEALGN